ncbi:uncharacterized protein PAC_04676 [Phialocephala subalpina]|uniref:Heterokaryon incompatibility domain-containing protein n=1 Tax=Phialocephala subalpina TaxID=576137 RepID=A0A1L7WPV2_9HELO|nr:uncharacterized protein PAC_04676 [Phialocephala subalpina]
MTAYSYTPLSDSSENCRFLILKPEALRDTPWEPELRNMITTPSYSDSASTEGSRALRGLIVETPLSVAADRGFSALSYCWGSDDRCFEILINDGQRLGITQELENAIRHLAVSIIWIDQICIDQTNLQEKAAQIPLMARIYREATEVIIWLGLPSADSNIAFEYAAKISVLYTLTQRCFKENFSHDADPLQISKPLGEAELANGRLNNETAMAMLHLFQRPWFGRMWTIQEQLLAKSGHFQCGLQSLHIWDMLRAATFMKVVSNFLGDGILSMPGTSGPAWLKEKESWGPFIRRQSMSDHWPLHQLLLEAHFGSSAPSATDARDMIYGMLSLASDIEQLGIIPNYSVSCETVFRDIARRIIVRGGFIDYLAYVNGRAPVPNLPSWAYDPRVANKIFGAPLNTGTLPLNVSSDDKQHLRACPFNVSGDKRQPLCDVDMDVDEGEQKEFLRIQGVEVDRISDLGNFKIFEGDDIAYVEVIWLVMIVAYLHQRDKDKLESLYSFPERALEAIWRTPLEDCYYEVGEGARRADRRAYVGWEQIFRDVQNFATASSSTTAMANDTQNGQDGQDGHHLLLFARIPGKLNPFEDGRSQSLPIAGQDLDAGEIESNINTGTNGAAIFQPLVVLSDIAKVFRMFPTTTTNEQYEWTNRIRKLKSRRPFVTQKGYLGMAPSRSQADDVVVVLYGGKVPYVIRPIPGNPDHFELIGACYCDGIMDGELFQTTKEVEDRIFVLV